MRWRSDEHTAQNFTALPFLPSDSPNDIYGRSVPPFFLSLLLTPPFDQSIRSSESTLIPRLDGPAQKNFIARGVREWFLLKR